MQDAVKHTVGKFLEYVMENHRVSREPATILQAFQLSLVSIFLSPLLILSARIFFLKIICWWNQFFSSLTIIIVQVNNYQVIVIRNPKKEDIIF